MMAANIRKYKILLLTGLLLAYLAGSFQTPLLQGLHLISHLAQKIVTDHQDHYLHVHEDGAVHSHRHVILEVIDSSLDWFSDDAIPSSDHKKNADKKNPELRSVHDPIVFFYFSTPTKPVRSALAATRIFPSVPTPPPKS